MTEYVIDVVTRLQDNQDGGYTMYVYNDTESMLADHPLAEDWDRKKKCIVQKKLTQEQIDMILNGDDEYQNGYIGSDKIRINVEDGVAKLVGKLTFHGGQ